MVLFMLMFMLHSQIYQLLDGSGRAFVCDTNALSLLRHMALEDMVWGPGAMHSTTSTTRLHTSSLTHSIWGATRRRGQEEANSLP